MTRPTQIWLLDEQPLGLSPAFGQQAVYGSCTHLSWSSILVAHCSRHIFPKDTNHSNREVTGMRFKTTFRFGHLLWRKTNLKSFEEAAKAFWESFINTQGYFKFSRREFYKSLKDVTAKRLLRRTKIPGRPPPGQWRFMGIDFPLDWRTRHRIREGFEKSPVLRKGFCFLLWENMI